MDTEHLIQSFRKAKHALCLTSGADRNRLLEAIAAQLLKDQEKILHANERDLQRARKQGVSDALQDRLSLSESRLQEIASGVRELCHLPDPLGKTLGQGQIQGGPPWEKISVPLGVIGIVYEARPNVTVDAAALALKSGNAIFLRGSSSAESSNVALVASIATALRSVNLPEEAVALFPNPTRENFDSFLQMQKVLDVIIPRGGRGLIERVVRDAHVSVLETGSGVCHVYIDSAADQEKALAISFNGKTHRPSVCNATETILVHTEALPLLPKVVEALQRAGVEIRGCTRTCEALPGNSISAATAEDWSTEYLDLIVSIRVVESLEDACDHIEEYGTMHSECIVTEDQQAAEQFLQRVDAACVYHNASTRFTDGHQFGFGAEIGISTQKLHARGPMALPELTSYKFVLRGKGDIRQ